MFLPLKTRKIILEKPLVGALADLARA